MLKNQKVKAKLLRGRAGLRILGVGALGRALCDYGTKKGGTDDKC